MPFPSLKFRLRSSHRYLPLIRGLVGAFGSCCPALTKVDIYRCAASLVEAFNNAVTHAHGARAEMEIEIEMRACRRSLVFLVTDRGRGFRLFRVKRPPATSTHGRGLVIIEAFMKNVSYKKNTLRMEYEL